MNTIKLLTACIMVSCLLTVSAYASEHNQAAGKQPLIHKHVTSEKMDMRSNTTKSNEIIRKGKIDLKAIDKNKDGKVYQDQMDWNVISDAPGKCPLCKMMLKEVSLKEAENNLLNNGFKIKKK